jgi:DNA polymerase IV
VPTDLAHDIHAAARDLLASVQIPRAGIRLLGVRAERLTAAATTGVQSALDDDPQQALAERAMDGVRARFGSQILRPASLLGNNRHSAFKSGSGDLS